MMGAPSKRDIWLVVIAGFLAVNVAIAFHFYASGKQTVALKATRDSLSVVVAQKKVIQQERDSVGAELVIASAKSAETRTVYVNTKSETKIVGDSAYDSTGHFIQVLDPRITARIASADEHVTSLESELARAKGLLKVDTVFIAKQGEETELNKHIAEMVKGPSHFSHGIQIGVGETLSSDGVKRASIYIGYGVQIGMP